MVRSREPSQIEKDMGPIALFDKSFIQSLLLDEAVFFDRFFLAVICPVFYVETLADLEKNIRKGRTPEQEVGIIAVLGEEARSIVFCQVLAQPVNSKTGIPGFDLQQ